MGPGAAAGRASHLLAVVPEAAFAGERWQTAPVRRFEASPAGYEALGTWLDGFGVPPADIRAGLEPTGGYYAQTIAACLWARGCRVDWLQNWAVHDQRQLLVGKQTKTDALDARLIARLLFLREHGLAAGAFLDAAPSPAAEALRLLVRNSWKLVQLRARHLLQLIALLDVTFPELRLVFRNSSVGHTALMVLERYPTPAAVAPAPLADLEHLIVIEAHAPSSSARCLGFTSSLPTASASQMASTRSSRPSSGWRARCGSPTARSRGSTPRSNGR